ncbi:hypothetical protein GE061_015608 [Apolygus lucorum]|uniref:Odorant receptor n=1 Tax=Apolygus lucorum TaxID=248454 RepID=A0A8S9XQJ6_APOLU|nr:hypothetical protein GE061_015608 [Apolygus lucorum]
MTGRTVELHVTNDSLAIQPGGIVSNVQHLSHGQDTTRSAPGHHGGHQLLKATFDPQVSTQAIDTAGNRVHAQEGNCPHSGEMSESVAVFKSLNLALKVLGFADSTSGIKSYLWTTWNFIIIIIGVEFIAITTLLNIIQDNDIYFKLECVLIIISTMSMTVRIIILTARKKRLFSLIDKIESLLRQMEEEFDEVFLPALARRCDNWAYLFEVIGIVFLSNAVVMTYVKYYFRGVEDPVPFEVALPFEKKNNIHAVVWYEVFQFFGCCIIVVCTNVLFSTLSQTTSELVKKIAERFEKIDETNADYLLKQTIKWHTEVIGITKETNDILGITIFADTFFALQYISIAGFLLMRVGLDNTTSFSKYFITYICMLTNPIYFCYSGHRVSLMSDVLYNSIYNNKWYRLAPKTSRNLILPLIVARKGLSWNYRGIMNFDMALYLEIVKQSYSIITFLKMIK